MPMGEGGSRRWMGGGDTTEEEEEEEEEEESDGGVGRSGEKSVSSSGALMASIVEHEEVWEDFDEGEVMDDEEEDEDHQDQDQDQEQEQEHGKGGVGGEAGDSNADPKRNLREGSHKGSLKEDSSSEDDEEDADQGGGGGGAGAFARALQVGRDRFRDMDSHARPDLSRVEFRALMYCRSRC
jgi:hypothetical protein